LRVTPRKDLRLGALEAFVAGALVSAVCSAGLVLVRRRRGAAAARREQTRASQLRALFDEAPVGYHEIDREGRVLRVNHTELQMLGWDEADMLGRHIWEFIVQQGQSREAIAAKIDGRAPIVPFERTFRRKDGTTIDVLMEDRLIREEDGRVAGIRTTLMDISARKVTEAAHSGRRIDDAQVRRDGAGAQHLDTTRGADGRADWLTSELGHGSTFAFAAEFHRGTRAGAPVAAEREFTGLRVLAVDDNATNRRILEETLGRWGTRSIVEASGEAGLATLRQAAAAGAPYEMVLLDYNMPDMDGFTVADQIKRDPQLSGTIILMLTSSGQRSEIERCKTSGIAAYLTKPVTKIDLRAAMLGALRPPAVLPQTTASAVPAQGQQRQLRVLLAEDNVVNQLVTTRVLEKSQHSVRVVANGIEAVGAAQDGIFDLILMDVQMPLLDGFEATQQIRELEKHTGRRVPIVAMTAHAMTGDRERCLAAGMDDYLAKPLQLKALAAILAHVASGGGWVEAPG
jgi:PAS domain S-box-containing protein